MMKNNFKQMTFLNNILDNDILFYGMFIGITCHLGYSFAKAYLNSFYVDKGTQTDA
jgi:hypothetical protein